MCRSTGAESSNRKERVKLVCLWHQAHIWEEKKTVSFQLGESSSCLKCEYPYPPVSLSWMLSIALSKAKIMINCNNSYTTYGPAVHLSPCASQILKAFTFFRNSTQFIWKSRWKNFPQKTMQAWWHMPAIKALRKKNQEFKARNSFSYIQNSRTV